jgi:uncharacterized membrane protein YgdD (TMEM256/DUF423 family)
MRSGWFPLGMLVMAVAVGAGAFGAHGLRSVLSLDALHLWETAVRYLVIGAAGVVAVGLAAELRPSRGWSIAGGALFVGASIFSGTVAALALGAPRWLGAVTPVGGVLLIVGFVAGALAAARR